MKTPLLDVRGLALSFHTSIPHIEILRGISFHLYPGEIVGLIGESGCGKSLTAFSLLKLLPPTISYTMRGEVFFEGNNLLDKSEKEMNAIRGKKISFIFQDPDLALNPIKRIGDQLLEGLIKQQKMNKYEANQRGIEWLKKVGIGDAVYRMRQYPHEISGGMKQRILIAMALACHPLLVIADEPTTALDLTTQAQILELLKKFQTEQQTTILLITHDLGVIAHCCDRLMVMYAGQIVESGSLEQLFYNPQHPYTQALIRAKQSLLKSDERPLFTLPGCSPFPSQNLVGCTFASRCPHAMRICQQMAPALNRYAHQQVACWLTHKKDKQL